MKHNVQEPTQEWSNIMFVHSYSAEGSSLSVTLGQANLCQGMQKKPQKNKKKNKLDVF